MYVSSEAEKQRLREQVAGMDLKEVAAFQQIQTGALLTEQDLQFVLNPAHSPEERARHLQMIGQIASSAVINGQLFYGTTEEEFTNPALWNRKFSRARALVDLAAQIGIQDIRGHHMVWGNEAALPRWLVQGRIDDRFDDQALRTILQQRITQLASNFSFSQWSVVNELVPRSEAGKNFWRDTLGEAETLDLAFTTARQVAPNATLIYNDFGNHNANTERGAYCLEMVRAARKRGTPIDTVGMQLHLRHDSSVSVGDTAATMRAYQEIGVGVSITELNIKLNGFTGSREEAFAIQAERYHDVWEAVMRSNGACRHVSFFGVHNETSYFNDPNVGPANAHAHLAEQHQFTPAVQRIKEAIVGL